MPDEPDPEAMATAISDDGFVYGSKPLPRNEFTHSLLVVASFIAWHKENHLMGGYRQPEAWAALCKLFGFDQVEFMKIVKGEDDDATS